MRRGKRRTRLISLRLGEEEYAALCHLSVLQGAHTLSHLTRTILSDWVARTNSLLRGVPYKTDLRERLAGLQVEIQRLANEVDRCDQPSEKESGPAAEQ